MCVSVHVCIPVNLSLAIICFEQCHVYIIYIYLHICSVVSDSVTFWTVACQSPLSMEFPRHEYWSGLPFPSPGDLPNPGIELTSPVSPALRLILYPLSHLGSHKYECMYVYVYIYIYMYTHTKKNAVDC